MKDLIEQLKQNEKPICLLSPEEYAKMRALPNGSLECLQESSTVGKPIWKIIGEVQWEYVKGRDTYRVFSLYTEPVEDEYELYEIIWNNRIRAIVHGIENESGIRLHEAAGHVKFAGYLYEDKVVRPYPVVYLDNCKCHSHAVSLKKLQDGNEIPTRPTHVVFKKG